MMKTCKYARNLPNPGLTAARLDAHAAADAAAEIASGSGLWASRAHAGVDDAVEAARCAMRARQHAESAERCSTVTEAWSCAQLAWAAVSSAIEASERVTAAIAERLVA